MRVSSAAVDRLVKMWNSGIYDYGDVEKFWIGHHPAVCRNNYTLKADNGESWYFGVGQYAKVRVSFGKMSKLNLIRQKSGIHPGLRRFMIIS